MGRRGEEKISRMRERREIGREGGREREGWKRSEAWKDEIKRRLRGRW